MNLTWQQASTDDLRLLAKWNHQLIRDEGHRNPMTVEQLRDRMEAWLQTEYRAIIFSDEVPVAYALFKEENSLIYLRQFFVARDRRKSGVGSAAFETLRRKIWPAHVRITVDVLCQNHGAIAFWRSLGYTDYALTLEMRP